MTDTISNGRSGQKPKLLFEPFVFGDLKLSNRIVMAPLTRMRLPEPDAVVRVLEVIPPWVRTELLNRSEEPRAMFLDEFLAGTMAAPATDANEIMVPHAKLLRDQAGPNEALFVSSFNEQLEAPQP